MYFIGLLAISYSRFYWDFFPSLRFITFWFLNYLYNRFNQSYFIVFLLFHQLFQVFCLKCLKKIHSLPLSDSSGFPIFFPSSTFLSGFELFFYVSSFKTYFIPISLSLLFILYSFYTFLEIKLILYKIAVVYFLITFCLNECVVF